MNKSDGMYQDDVNREINFIDLNQPINILLASNSKFFLEGIRKVLNKEKNMKIAGEALNREEIEKILEEIKPDILLIDNRVLRLNAHEILDLMNSKTKLILISNYNRDVFNLPCITFLTKETDSRNLIQIIRKSLHKSIAINIEEYKPSALCRLEEFETIELTEEVFFQSDDEKVLFDEEDLSLAQEELDDANFLNTDLRKRDRYSRVRAVSQASLLLLLVSGVIYFGVGYMSLDHDLRGFISEHLFPQTDPKIKFDIKTELSEQGFRDISVSVAGGKTVLTQKVSTEEDYKKIGSIAKEVKGVKEVENPLVAEKIATDSKIMPKMEGTESSQYNTNEGPEENNGEISYLNGKNGMINRSVVEKESDGSRRKAVLAELDSYVKKKNTIEVARTNYKRPKKLESNKRVPGLPSDKDTSIASEIKKALVSEGYKDIKVSVDNGEVFLTGSVETHQDHILLHRIALKIGGVKRVRSDLLVPEYSTTSETISGTNQQSKLWNDK